LTVDSANVLQNRFVLQTIIFQCFAQHDLDAVVYPTGNIPNRIMTNPPEPNVNDRGNIWSFINARGFPAITVPAGFTTQVFDRVVDPVDPTVRHLVGPIPAELPVGIDFLCLPFGEPKCIKIASAYEAATHHRTPPPDFGPVDENGIPLTARTPGKPRPMPKPFTPTEEEIRAGAQN
jgi:Asp-tRNA(Asn)/Glu-tRNA(Gln) amidotransferase A subunit family amidase